jgi:Na+/H+ antiporter NhaC
MILLLGIALAVITWMMLITAVARDMDARGRDGRVYGLLMLLLPVGLVFWLVNRARYPRVLS